MGCFNKIGFYSKLPIKYGDEIVMFICISDGRMNDDTPCYFNTFLEPIYLPIFGTYNDYGGIENIVRNNAIEALENALGDDIEMIIESIEENAFKPISTNKDEWCLYDDILDNLLKTIPSFRMYMTSKYKKNYGLCVTMEHKSVYDTMCGLYKHFEEPQEYDFMQLNVGNFLDKAIESINNINEEELNKLIILKKELKEKGIVNESIDEMIEEKNKKCKNIFEGNFFNREVDRFANETIYHNFHHNMMLVNLVELDYKLLRDIIYNFTYFNYALSFLNGRYDVSSYGSQSVIEYYKEFKKLHQCYNEIIEKLKYEED